MFSPEKRKYLVETMGEDRAKQIESVLGVMAKEMSDKGVAFKDYVEDYLKDSAPPATDPAKSVPPSSASADPAPGSVQPDIAEQIKQAMKEALAPVTELAAKVAALETGERWVPKATPEAASKSVQITGGAKDDGKSWLAEAAEAAQKDLNSMDDFEHDPVVAPEVAWHFQALGGAHMAAASANGHAGE